MAEARRAVMPLPAINLDRPLDPKLRRWQAAASQDGLSIFIPHPKYWPGTAKRLVKTVYTKCKKAFSPVPLPVVAAAEIFALSWLLSSKSGSWIRESRVAHWLWRFDSYMPFTSRLPTNFRVGYLTFNFSAGVMFTFTFAHRMVLRGLLSYTGWLDQVRGPRSIKTAVWGALLKYIYTRNDVVPTYAYQTSLPKFPLPEVKDTVKKYLDSMEFILKPEEFAELKKLSEEFQNNEAKQLQRYLRLKHLTSSNYVNDWWRDVVYLRGRDSLMINSNYYGLGLGVFHHTNNQAARAAVLVEQFLLVKQELDQERFPRMMIQGMVPLCMAQYPMIFSTTREPAPEIDKLVTYDPERSRHIVVMNRGRFYKVTCFADGSTSKPVNRWQFELAFRGILEEPDPTEAPKEAHLGALTAANRNKWAEWRTDLFLRDRANRASLRTIETAVFVLCLDTEAMPYDKLAHTGRQLLHGTGRNRWFDKSFNLVVSSDGNAGVNGEHTWGDAPALAHAWETALAREIHLAELNKLYAADGSLLPAAGSDKPHHVKAESVPQLLHWHITKEINAAIQEADAGAQKAIAALQLEASGFFKFGKNVVKKMKCSPDAFVQMAIQLAYYRDTKGEFTQTYESAMTRLYREGRTETIRTAGKESVAFVKGMEDPAVPAEAKVKLLQQACEQHARKTVLAMTGRGVDRHLFALYVVAVGTQVESKFLKSVITRGWKLSTSQIPQNQCERDWEMTKHGIKNNTEVWPRPAGGFGPVADNGYGVCYTLASEKSFYFHVTTTRGFATDSARMLKNILTALEDIGNLLPKEAPKEAAPKKE